MTIFAGILLGLLAWKDWRTKTVPVAGIVILGMGLLLLRLQGQVTVPELFAGCIPGSVSLLFSLATGEKIGKGDGLLLLALGIGFGWEETLLFWMSALLLATAMGILFLILKKATRKTELPFLPFLFWGYALCHLVFL